MMLSVRKTLFLISRSRFNMNSPKLVNNLSYSTVESLDSGLVYELSFQPIVLFFSYNNNNNNSYNFLSWYDKLLTTIFSKILLVSPWISRDSHKTTYDHGCLEISRFKMTHSSENGKLIVSRLNIMLFTFQ